jgi:hypothetical protein
MEQRTILDYLTSPLEHERVQAVSDLLYQMDTYIRAIALGIVGLAVKAAAEGDAMREFLALRSNADEVSAWLCAHNSILRQHLQGVPVPVPAKAEAEAKTEEVVLH